MVKSKKANLGKNVIYMVIFHLFNALTPLITTPYLSRVLGAEQIGKYSYAYSLAYYFVLLANLGITTHGSRRIAEVKDNPQAYQRRMSDLFWVHIFNASIVTIAYVIAILMGMNRQNAVLSYIMIFYVLSSVVDVKWLFYGLENFKITVLRSIIIKVFYIVLIFVFVKNRDDLTIYTFIMAFVAYFLVELSLFLLLPRYGKILKPDFSSMKKEILPLIILFIPSVANLLLRHFDKLMLGWMSTYDQLGMYENTDKVFLVLVTLITAVGDVMMPRMSNILASENEEKAQKLFYSGMRISIIVSCALAFGLMGIATDFVPLFFGDEFMGCIQLLTWIAPTIIMLTLSALIRKQYLIPRYLEKVYLTATISSLVINIVANAIFIPYFGAMGAVYGTLIAEFSVILIQFIMIHKMLDYKPLALDLLKYCIVGFVMLMAVKLVPYLNRILNLNLKDIFLVLIEILIGGIVYTLLTFVILKLTKDDLLVLLKKKAKKFKK